MLVNQQATAQGKKDVCTKGLSCGVACIAKEKECLKKLGTRGQLVAIRLQQLIDNPNTDPGVRAKAKERLQNLSTLLENVYNKSSLKTKLIADIQRVRAGKGSDADKKAEIKKLSQAYKKKLDQAYKDDRELRKAAVQRVAGYMEGKLRKIDNLQEKLKKAKTEEEKLKIAEELYREKKIFNDSWKAMNAISQTLGQTLTDKKINMTTAEWAAMRRNSKWMKSYAKTLDAASAKYVQDMEKLKAQNLSPDQYKEGSRKIYAAYEAQLKPLYEERQIQNPADMRLEKSFVRSALYMLPASARNSFESSGKHSGEMVHTLVRNKDGRIVDMIRSKSGDVKDSKNSQALTPESFSPKSFAEARKLSAFETFLRWGGKSIETGRPVKLNVAEYEHINDKSSSSKNDIFLGMSWLHQEANKTKNKSSWDDFANTVEAKLTGRNIAGASAGRTQSPGVIRKEDAVADTRSFLRNPNKSMKPVMDTLDNDAKGKTFLEKNLSKTFKDKSTDALDALKTDNQGGKLNNREYTLAQIWAMKARYNSTEARDGQSKVFFEEYQALDSENNSIYPSRTYSVSGKTFYDKSTGYSWVNSMSSIFPKSVGTELRQIYKTQVQDVSKRTETTKVNDIFTQPSVQNQFKTAMSKYAREQGLEADYYDNLFDPALFK